MKRTTGAGIGLATAAAAVVVWLGGAGCETVEEFDKMMTLSPSSTNITEVGAAVMFNVSVNGVSNLTASGTSSNSTTMGPPVILPIEWSVSHPALGTIQSASGLSAVYQRNGAAVGNNTVYARDAGRRYEAIAVVSQTLSEDEAGTAVTNATTPVAKTGAGALSVVPASTVLTNGPPTTVSFSITAETLTDDSAPVEAPFVWRVSDTTLGNIAVSGGRTAIYVRFPAALGANYITVTDSSGRYSGTAVVEQR